MPKKYSDDELIAGLRELANKLGSVPTGSDINEDPNLPTVQTYYNRFDSLSQALQQAGVDSDLDRFFGEGYDDDEILEAIISWASEQGRVPQSDDVRQSDEFPSLGTIRRRFGGLAEAYAEAIAHSSADPQSEMGSADDETTIDITRGVDLEIVFDGTPEDVRSFNYGDEFGLLVSDLPPEQALDVMAADPDAESAWVALRDVLLELADAGCNTAEMVDYLATQKCGISPEEWSGHSNGSEDTVRNNSYAAGSNLRESMIDAEE